jgi:hypothetical protein
LDSVKFFPVSETNVFWLWGGNLLWPSKKRSDFVTVWRAGTATLFVVPARQATWAGEIDSSESIFGLHKRSQIRARFVGKPAFYVHPTTSRLPSADPCICSSWHRVLLYMKLIRTALGTNLRILWLYYSVERKENQHMQLVAISMTLILYMEYLVIS